MSQSSEFKARIDSIELQLAGLQSGIQQLGFRDQPTIITTKPPFLHQLVENVNGIVGLREIVSNKTLPLKVLWAALFIFGVASTIFFTFETGLEYLAEPTATKVNLEITSHFRFPPLLLCLITWLDTDKALSTGLTEDGLKYSLGYIAGSKSVPIDNPTKARNDFLSFYNSRNFFCLLDVYSAFAIDLPIFYTDAEFDNVSSAIKLGDAESKFSRRLFRDGICYAFDYGVIDFAWSTSKMTSAKMVDKSRGLLGEGNGWWLVLGIDSTRLLTNVVPSLYLPSFTENSVIIHARKFSTLRRSDAECRTDEDVEKTGYSRNVCVAQCQNEQYSKQRKCKALHLSMPDELTDPSEICHSNAPSPEQPLLLTKYRDVCLERCPQECTRIIHQMALQSQQALPRANTSSDSFIVLYVDHSSVYEGGILTITEVNTYSFTALVNNVGGTLGLFVGGTLMTLAQVVLFLVKYVMDSRLRKGVGDNGGVSKMA